MGYHANGDKLATRVLRSASFVCLVEAQVLRAERVLPPRSRGVSHLDPSHAAS